MTNANINNDESKNLNLHYIQTGYSIIIPIEKNYLILANVKPIHTSFDNGTRYNITLSMSKNIKPYIWHEFEDELILTSSTHQIYSMILKYIEDQYLNGNLTMRMYTVERVYSLMELSGDYLAGSTDDLSSLEGGDD